MLRDIPKCLYRHFKLVPVFSMYTQDDMDKIYDHLTEHTYKTGDHIIEDSKNYEGITIIISGQVRISDPM